MSDIRTALTSAGFTVDWLLANADGKLRADDSGDYLRVSRNVTWNGGTVGADFAAED